MSDTIQNIHIQHFNDGSFSVKHNHLKYNDETYIIKSKSGLLPVIRNLINMKKPDLSDLYLKENAVSKSSVEKALPID